MMKKFALVLAATTLFSTCVYATTPTPTPAVELPNFILNGDFEEHNGAKFSTIFTNWEGQQSIAGTIALGPNDQTPDTVDNYVKTVKKGNPITTFTQKVTALPKGNYTLSVDSGGGPREAAYIEILNATGAQVAKIDLIENDTIDKLENSTKTDIALEGDITVRVYIAGLITTDVGKIVLFDNVELTSQDGHVPAPPAPPVPVVPPVAPAQ